MKHSALALVFALTLSAQDRSVPIDNDQVKVLKVTQAPHIKTKLHKHDMNRVMIYLQAGKQTIAYQGANTAHLNWKAGEALWSPKSGMHIAEITSDNPVTIVELELKNAGRKVTMPAKDPLKVAPAQYKLEMENDQVRVLRSRVGPKGSIPQHEHGLNRVVVFLTDQDFKITKADGTVDMLKHKAGDVTWSGPVTHKEENLSDKPFEILIVEIK
ncbi:MAG: hypothetical protein K2X03_06880 [Bryobacteraceae bacterium]|nr:hypothetical protein [Bryobacteraceae bacterium]